MEDQGRPSGEGGDDALFSERIRLWLDEGDRLEAEAVAAPAAEPPDEESARGSIARLRQVASRHRLGVMAGMGLLPLALFVALHRGSAAPPVSSISVAPAAALTAAPPPPAASAVAAAEPAAAAPPGAPAAGPVAVAEPSADVPEAAAEPADRPAHHHHHHHHHHRAARDHGTGHR
jgi:hypothetical protein